VLWGRRRRRKADLRLGLDLNRTACPWCTLGLVTPKLRVLENWIVGSLIMTHQRIIRGLKGSRELLVSAMTERVMASSGTSVVQFKDGLFTD
jgi:hypothetical protein